VSVCGRASACSDSKTVGRNLMKFDIRGPLKIYTCILNFVNIHIIYFHKEILLKEHMRKLCILQYILQISVVFRRKIFIY
jgi:hypothetical protein